VSETTIQYSGAGSNAGIGQNRNPDADWPLVRVKSYIRDIDFAGPSARTKIVRLQNGTETPQEQVILSASPWSTQYDVWLYPFAFLKGAMAGNPWLNCAMVHGRAFMVQNKHKVAVHRRQELIYKVETWVDNPVSGTCWSKRQRLQTSAALVPTTIINKQGGHNASADAGGSRTPPLRGAADAQAPAAPPVSSAEDGVYYLMGGTHHSVVVSLRITSP
jgi:hypothetical protein